MIDRDQADRRLSSHTSTELFRILDEFSYFRTDAARETLGIATWHQASARTTVELIEEKIKA
jgi:hypothetical protein